MNLSTSFALLGVLGLACGGGAQSPEQETSARITESDGHQPEAAPSSEIALGETAGVQTAKNPPSPSPAVAVASQGAPASEEPATEEAGPASLLPASLDEYGLGACASVKLSELVSEIQAEYPELAEVKTFVPHPLYLEDQAQAEPVPGDSFIEALVPPEQMVISFTRCVGELVGGYCSETRSTVFETGADCALGGFTESVERFNGSCFDVEGEPHPEFRHFAEERLRCDFNPMAANVAGLHHFIGLSMGQPCGDDAFSSTFEVLVTQSEEDLSRAVFRIESGPACLSGIDFPASVFGTTVEVDAPVGPELDDGCVAAQRLTATVDMAGNPIFGGQFVGYLELVTPATDCARNTSTSQDGNYHLMPSE